MTHIIHLSDAHFNAGKHNPIPFSLIEAKLIDFLSNLNGNIVLVLSGDITFKGLQGGYDQAAVFFKSVIEKSGLSNANILICPGNHDIMQSKPFTGLDAFSYHLRRDKALCFSQESSFSIVINNVYFLITNSSHHLDRNYGLADIDGITRTLENHPPDLNVRAKILITHHHLYPLFEHDSSATRNAYDLISLMDNNGFNLILHGHQHFSMGFPAGHSPVHTFGVSSFNLNAPGILNGFNHYHVRGKEIHLKRCALFFDGPAANKKGFLPIGSKSVLSIP